MVVGLMRLQSRMPSIKEESTQLRGATTRDSGDSELLRSKGCVKLGTSTKRA